MLLGGSGAELWYGSDAGLMQAGHGKPPRRLIVRMSDEVVRLWTVATQRGCKGDRNLCDITAQYLDATLINLYFPTQDPKF